MYTFLYVYRCCTSCEQPSHWPMSTMLGRVALRAIILTFANLYTTCTYRSISVRIYYYKRHRTCSSPPRSSPRPPCLYTPDSAAAYALQLSQEWRRGPRLDDAPLMQHLCMIFVIYNILSIRG